MANYEMGMIGLGVMGRNLLLNMADHGFSVAGYDLDDVKIKALREQTQSNHDIAGFGDLNAFVASLKSPRVVMLLVPAGKPVDDVIDGLLPLLDKGDLIIDGGNSHFVDTDRRIALLEEKGLRFLGVGISGGEKGARRGPSIMPGGSEESYERIRPIFEAIAARVVDTQEPCVAYLGKKSAGHYVKMVHNGIEYGIMQLIAEVYQLMKSGLGMDNHELAETFERWNGTPHLKSFLIQITADIFRQEDPRTGKCLIDYILDVAKQKGTGIWSSMDSMELRVPIAIIDTAVAMRDMSVFKEDRTKLNKLLVGPKEPCHGDKEALLQDIEVALAAAIRMTYAQGMSLLRAASQHYEYGLNLATVARVWREGCIIRSALLDEIGEAFTKEPDLSTLMLDGNIAQRLNDSQGALRRVAQVSIGQGLAMPALLAALCYYDAYRSEWLPANLIQAQRDNFGAHSYGRIDEVGTFHTEWTQELKEQAHV